MKLSTRLKNAVFIRTPAFWVLYFKKEGLKRSDFRTGDETPGERSRRFLEAATDVFTVREHEGEVGYEVV